MVAPKDFFSGVGNDLLVLASNLKQTLEEANGITEQVKPIQDDVETTDQNHTQDDSPVTEN